MLSSLIAVHAALLRAVSCFSGFMALLLLSSGVFASNPNADAYKVPDRLFSGEPRGPYVTGTLEELWVNDAIDDPTTAMTGDPRRLMVQVWYPAALPDDPHRAPYAISPGLYDADHWVHKVAHVETQSVLDAPVIEGTERLPILVYNHGGIHPHFSGTFQTEFLASHGYVVVSIGHSGANEIRRFPDGTNYVNDGKRWNGQAPVGETLSRRGRLEKEMATADLSLHVQDIGFVLDRLTQLDNDPASRFHGRLDLDRVGSLGWSLGGFTSLQATRDEPRVKAAANLDGWPHGLLGPKGVVTLGSERPILLMFAREDEALRTPGQNDEADAARIEMGMAAATHYWTLLERSTADWYHITIDRTDHGSFADVSLFEQPAPGLLHPRAAHAIINAYVLEFFDRYVKAGVSKEEDSPLLFGRQRYREATVLRSAKKGERR